MNGVPKHLQQFYSKLAQLPVTAPPKPWRKVMHAVGGLTDVAFDDSSDLLVILSSSGRGLFNCLTGERIDRDDGDAPHYTSRLLVDGIGQLKGKRLRTAGLHGGGLPVSSGGSEWWGLNSETLVWPTVSIFLTPPGQWFWGAIHGKPTDITKVAEDSELRASGFSPTGNSFVVATSSDVAIFSRVDA